MSTDFECAEMKSPAGVVITATELAHAEPDREGQPGDAYVGVDDVRSDNVWEATDPHLGGSATCMGMWHYHPSPVDANVEAVSMTVVDEDGSWSGTGRGDGSTEFGDILWLVLTGDGAYEGLAAYLTQDNVNEAGTIRGVVIADDLQPFPEPVFAV